MQFRVITDNLPLLVHGLLVTIEVSVFAIVVGSIVGALVAVGRLSRVGVLSLPLAAYVEVFRNTPLLVQLLLLFLAPSELGFRLDGVQALGVALALNNGAYVAEILRGGMQSVPRGQLEAAASIGLRPARTFVDIVLPQALRAVYPALTNQFIAIVLASSLGAIIGSGELTTIVLEVNSQTYRTVELLAFLTVAYALMNYLLTHGLSFLGARLQRAYGR